MMAWLWLLACSDPLVNDPPVLLEVNGVPTGDFYRWAPGQLERLTVNTGEDFEIQLTWRDPEGDDVRVWWPWAPPGWSFDPDSDHGVWLDPDPETAASMALSFLVVLEDQDARSPRAQEFIVPLNIPGLDAGTPNRTY